MKTKSAPTIGMREFFELPAVKTAQDTQKRTPYGSEPHRKAHNVILALAAKYGAQRFIGEY